MSVLPQSQSYFDSLLNEINQIAEPPKIRIITNTPFYEIFERVPNLLNDPNVNLTLDADESNDERFVYLITFRHENAEEARSRADYAYRAFIQILRKEQKKNPDFKYNMTYGNYTFGSWEQEGGSIKFEAKKKRKKRCPRKRRPTGECPRKKKRKNKSLLSFYYMGTTGVGPNTGGGISIM